MKRLFIASALLTLSGSALASAQHYDGCTDAQNNPDSFTMTEKGKYGVMI
ncbi:hypothetical protein [Pseudenterobacter timonensis]|uniref:Uncharacterized protein n=1 Tax=Pseudenterobacter timonensis TaxID=1755099 RepID=A0ABV4A4H6_9ENTR